MLVLQLVAGRLLAPFVGSDLYTWTAVIGVFLTGIALGNAYGGRLADRFPSPRTLAVPSWPSGRSRPVWMAVFPVLLTEFKPPAGDKSVPPLSYTADPARRPHPAADRGVLCLPAGFVLSLLTPLAIKIGLSDVSRVGRVSGMVFALSHPRLPARQLPDRVLPDPGVQHQHPRVCWSAGGAAGAERGDAGHLATGPAPP